MWIFSKKINYYIVLFVLIYIVFSVGINAEENKQEESAPKIETITKVDGENKIVENKTSDDVEKQKKDLQDKLEVNTANDQEKHNDNTSNEKKDDIKDKKEKVDNIGNGVGDNIVNDVKDNKQDVKDNKQDVSVDNLTKDINEKVDKNDNVKSLPSEQENKLDEKVLKNLEKDIIKQDEKQVEKEKTEEQKTKTESEQKIIEDVKREEQLEAKKEEQQKAILEQQNLPLGDKEKEQSLNNTNQVENGSDNATKLENEPDNATKQNVLPPIDNGEGVNKEKTLDLKENNNQDNNSNINNQNTNVAENLNDKNLPLDAHTQEAEANNNNSKQNGVNVDKQGKTDKVDKDKKKNDIVEEVNVDKLFTIFEIKKALDFDYNKIKGENFSLLENAEELKTIKQVIKEQHDPAIKMKREREEKIKKENEQKMQSYKDIVKPIENTLYISSLFYLSDNDWRTRINRKKITNKEKDKTLINNTSIVKVNKTSIIFLLQKPNTLVDKVKKIKESKVSYSNNYYLVADGKDIYIAFKLFIGQKINLDTMVITG